MTREAALSEDVDRVASNHLLRHYRDSRIQEEICFGLWYPSQGDSRLSAVVQRVLLPREGEVRLHGNASFEGRYVTRVIREARRARAGIALMHSHPSPGWQSLSEQDIQAERDEVAYSAQATGYPLLGLTIGDDGYWSGRFWFKEAGRMVGVWCRKIRVPTRTRYRIYWKHSALKKLAETERLRRTLETWGIGVQQRIQSLRVGVVGVGSVGAVVAESLARIGVSEITLIDSDVIEQHNLDRLLYGRKKRVGERKVVRARKEIEENSTASEVTVRDVPAGVECEDAYRNALDCDLIVSCVDRPVARDVLNYIAMAHLIPVIEGGVAVDVDPDTHAFKSTRWRSHIVVPGNACMRCTGQYNSSAVVAELDGSLDDPSYIANLPPGERPQHQNVFPFSLGSASMQMNLMLRYLLAEHWWPAIQRQEFRFISGRMRTSMEECSPYCSFRPRIAAGDSVTPSYLKREPRRGKLARLVQEVFKWLGKRSWKFLLGRRRVPNASGSAEERI